MQVPTSSSEPLMGTGKRAQREPSHYAGLCHGLSMSTPNGFTGYFYTVYPEGRIYNEKLATYVDREHGMFTKCYQLADFLQATDFKDVCIDFLINKMIVGDEHYHGIAKHIYAYSLESSPHRQFGIDCALNFWGKTAFERFGEQEFPQEFQNDLILALGLHLRNGLEHASVKEYFKNINHCKYHEHVKSGKPCYKTRFKHLP